MKPGRDMYLFPWVLIAATVLEDKVAATLQCLPFSFFHGARTSCREICGAEVSAEAMMSTRVEQPAGNPLNIG